MKVHTPHRPAPESEEFWYYPNEAVLLYESEGKPRPTSLSAKHSEQGRREHREARKGQREHVQPHGIKFRDGLLTPNQRHRSAANAEFVVRMCHELGLTPVDEENPGNQLLPLPKFLALFLDAKHTCMYEAESLTQAIILMQTRALIDRNHAAN